MEDKRIYDEVVRFSENITRLVIVKDGLLTDKEKDYIKCTRKLLKRLERVSNAKTEFDFMKKCVEEEIS